MCKCNQENTTCTSHGGRYDEHTCLSGWYPDPLLDVPTSGLPYVPKGFTQGMVLELCIPYGQTAANYSGSLEVLSALLYTVVPYGGLLIIRCYTLVKVQAFRRTLVRLDRWILMVSLTLVRLNLGIPIVS